MTTRHSNKTHPGVLVAVLATGDGGRLGLLVVDRVPIFVGGVIIVQKGGGDWGGVLGEKMGFGDTTGTGTHT